MRIWIIWIIAQNMSYFGVISLIYTCVKYWLCIKRRKIITIVYKQGYNLLEADTARDYYRQQRAADYYLTLCVLRQGSIVSWTSITEKSLLLNLPKGGLKTEMGFVDDVLQHAQNTKKYGYDIGYWNH